MGPMERPAAALFRAAFFSIEDFLDQLYRWEIAPKRVFELGCGEGLLAEQFLRSFPNAKMTGIDITDRIGRLFRGDRSRVTFIHQPLETFISQSPPAFDLAIICDVLHHVPLPQRADLIRGTLRVLQPGGCLIVKEWVDRPTILTRLTLSMERHLSGAFTHYESVECWRSMLQDATGQTAEINQAVLRPWANNVVFKLQS